MHSGNITSKILNADITLPGLTATNVVTWKCHMDDSTKSRYDIILGRHLLTELVLNFKYSDHIIEADKGNLKGLQHTRAIWVRIYLKI